MPFLQPSLHLFLVLDLTDGPLKNFNYQFVTGTLPPERVRDSALGQVCAALRASCGGTVASRGRGACNRRRHRRLLSQIAQWRRTKFILVEFQGKKLLHFKTELQSTVKGMLRFTEPPWTQPG